MEEEILEVIKADHVITEKYGTKINCALFLTSGRIIVTHPKGINKWLGTTTIITALSLALIGLALKNFVFFFFSFAFGTFLGLVLFGVDSAVRNIKVKRAKNSISNVLNLDKNLFYIPYKEITKVNVRSFEKLHGSSYLFPLIPSYFYEVGIRSQNGEYVFILDYKEYLKCIESLGIFIKDLIEISDFDE